MLPLAASLQQFCFLSFSARPAVKVQQTGPAPCTVVKGLVSAEDSVKKNQTEVPQSQGVMSESPGGLLAFRIAASVTG